MLTTAAKYFAGSRKRRICGRALLDPTHQHPNTLRLDNFPPVCGAGRQHSAAAARHRRGIASDQPHLWAGPCDVCRRTARLSLLSFE